MQGVWVSGRIAAELAPAARVPDRPETAAFALTVPNRRHAALEDATWRRSKRAPLRASGEVRQPSTWTAGLRSGGGIGSCCEQAGRPAETGARQPATP